MRFSRIWQCLLPLACVSLAAVAPAQTIERIARIEGAQEVPFVITNGGGLALVAIDIASATMTYRITHAGLSSAETAAHIHGFAPAGSNAAPLVVLPLGSPKCGVWSMTTAQLANVLGGLSYVNIHSVTNPAGEIRGQIDIAPDQPTLCYGDGSGTACPCGNFSAVGDNEGCLNSAGIGGRLRGYAGPAPSPSLSNDRLVLHALRLTLNTPVLFFQGTLPIAGGAGSVFGDGLRCIGGNIRRIAVKSACNGQAGMPEPGDLPLSAYAGVPGIIYYQAWYRNAVAFCTPATFNLTNGLQVTWVL